MIKQKLTLSVGLVSLLLGSLVAFPHRANAGQVVVPGTTPDSSTTSGDTFSITTITTTVIQGLSGVISSPGPVRGSFVLTVTQTIQIALNSFATNLFSQTTVTTTTIRGQVRELFTRRGGNTPALASRTTTNLLGYGVSSIRVSTLFVALSNVCVLTQASTPGTPVAQLTPELVASTKGLKADSQVAQAGDLATVDINKLNEAIEAYNAIVKESDPVTLQKLSQDETFVEIGRILKEFRASLV
ncbi:hypothetical protein FJR38_08055 [Anabaena sp. UHCC 0253]|uniref:hypothetical protein n=1 Tax=Anabaena sp. UHCC 0253 TaxID=2590019 RepID=UPI001446E551|nr:hypothetical protein [Anabaena sp. UHCC 0253]MTJ52615.1 hypothetical protein [Anabaena sp. UHCC 0253]